MTSTERGRPGTGGRAGHEVEQHGGRVGEEGFISSAIRHSTAEEP
jgi:hypothetical protein